GPGAAPAGRGYPRRPGAADAPVQRPVVSNLTSLRGHVDWGGAVAFSPDGQRLVSASTEPKRWEAAKGAGRAGVRVGGREGATERERGRSSRGPALSSRSVPGVLAASPGWGRGCRPRPAATGQPAP